ncbi:hypothetical protein ACOSP7_016871 [Xanthoceras sorbifolium]
MIFKVRAFSHGLHNCFFKSVEIVIDGPSGPSSIVMSSSAIFNFSFWAPKLLQELWFAITMSLDLKLSPERFPHLLTLLFYTSPSSLRAQIDIRHLSHLILHLN